MTGKKVYLNCAYMSPMLKKVEKAGIRGIHFQRKPDKIMPEHFFNNIEEIKTSFAKLINCQNPDRIAYVPAASYGLANVTNNIKLEKDATSSDTATGESETKKVKDDES